MASGVSKVKSKRSAWKQRSTSEDGVSLVWVRELSNYNMLPPVGESKRTEEEDLITRGFVRKLGSDGNICVWVPPEEVRGINAPFDMAAVASLDFKRKVILYL